jgi:uncharacterized protein involved in outer membrane biogenesis
MQDFFRSRPKAKWAGIILIAVAAALVLVLALFDWNLLRPALAKEITAKTGRQTTIAGDLRVHLWSWNPSIEVNEISLKNPSWADRPIMFGARRIGISVSLARLLRGQLVIPEIDLVEPTINLEREADGKASWELGDKVGAPKPASQPAKLPTIRRLIVERGKLHVVDQIRKLTFSGSLVAADQAGRNDSAAFQIRCTGTLNGKPFGLEANGGPLIDLEPDKPYSVSTRLTAADITLDSHIKFSKPFDFGSLEVKFVVSGNDLADVFYLTGLALPNTPKYRLAATVQVDGSLMEISDLQGHLGSSDISGQGHVDTAGKIPSLTATLFSKQLNIADLAPTLGEQAPQADSLAAKAPKAPHPARSQGTPSPSAQSQSAPVGAPPGKGGLLLPDADLQVDRVRGMNADITYRAAAVTAPKVPMKSVGFHLVLENGLLTMDPLSFGLDVGQFSGSVQIDARKDVPVTTIDMRIEKIDLGQFKSATMTSPPLQGVLQGRFQFHGAGSSLHKFASASNGTVSVVIPHGQIREAFAQLTGINVLKGLGLLLAKQDGEADIRCGIVDFKDHDGSLNTTTVYVDTSNVLITGRGHINLRDESIDLALQGDPKNVTFVRLRSPISIHGTLENPGVGLKAGKLAEQVGEAVALGAVLTPAAAALAFVDPGLAKDKDCSTVLAQASAGVRE